MIIIIKQTVSRYERGVVLEGLKSSKESFNGGDRTEDPKKKKKNREKLGGSLA